MGMSTQQSQQFAAILEKKLYDVTKERQALGELPDPVLDLYTDITDSKNPYEEFMELSTLGDIQEFNGKFTTQSLYEGFTTKIELKRYGLMVATDRDLVDDEKFGMLEEVAAGMVDGCNRLRRKNAVQTFARANTVAFDTMKSGEGVSLASTGHKTKVPGISTATGFSNSGTDALTKLSLAAARINMRKFRNSQGIRFNTTGDNYAIIHPDELDFKVQEILGTPFGLDTAEHNKNVQAGKYKSINSLLLSDYSSTSWGLIDMDMVKKSLKWIQRAKADYKVTIDFMTLATMQSIYERHGYGFVGWRWLYWNTVV